MASVEDSAQEEIELIGQAYLASRMVAWDEAYRTFNRFINRFKREFGPGRQEGKSMGLYDDMMEQSLVAMGEEPVYDSDDVVEIQHAFLYGGNRDIEFPEFRDTVTSILKGEKEWADYVET